MRKLPVPMVVKYIFSLCSVSVTIYEQPMDVSVLAPGAAVLHCQADGQPVPEIVWIRKVTNGPRAEFSVSTGNINIAETIIGLNKTSVLTIQPTTPQDIATYSCRAQNLVGTVTSTEAQVNVFGKVLIFLA